MSADHVERIRRLLRATIARADPDEIDALQALDALFDEPARIAIAGMVNAGKSTLLNALVGERVAPTDAGECTRIPTWYRKGRHYEVRAIDNDGGSDGALGFERRDELVVDLASRDPGTVDHLLVTCPTTRLTNHTLIDLPGHSSLSPDVARRAEDFLTADDAVPVDGVIYLLRHRHPADLEFLESFHSRAAGRGALGAVGVLSRADELFGGGLDAMDDAHIVADTLRVDRRIRGLCQDVVPVAGLLAESAAGLRNDEVVSLRTVASAPQELLETALTSVDRFRQIGCGDSTGEERATLLDRFGLFGVRAGVAALRRDPGRTADALSSDLLQLSGIGGLRVALDTVILQRVLDLRSRAVLTQLARSAALRSDESSYAELERIEANAHGLRELEIAEVLRRGSVPGIAADDDADLQRLLGVSGVSAHDRLGAPATAGRDMLRSIATAQHRRWMTLSESPLAPPLAVRITATASRTCEEMLASELAGD
ncbi:MAG: dynamin family protein [Acidimicrobiia bacterium]|nr:dynamin family protein [Acidimicrobiia bacterium]